jgi:Domain of unknown function (DUF4326)
MRTRVVRAGRRQGEDVTYIGRPTMWGNPFVIGRDGSRKEVIELYEQWISSHPKLVEEARRVLKGKALSCWCHPLACHGDVLVRICEEEV